MLLGQSATANCRNNKTHLANTAKRGRKSHDVLFLSKNLSNTNFSHENKNNQRNEVIDRSVGAADAN